MLKMAYGMAGLSLAAALACGTPANAQVLAHKDISLAMATTMATTMTTAMTTTAMTATFRRGITSG